MLARVAELWLAGGCTANWMRGQPSGVEPWRMEAVVWQNILPGLRELRAPLAAGYLWLLVLWLSLRPLVPPGGHMSGVYRDVIELGAWGGKPAVVAASTFAAYVIGILSLAATRRAGWIGLLVTNTWFRWVHPRYWRERTIHNALDEAAMNKLGDRFLEDASFRESAMAYLDEARKRAAGERRQLEPHSLHSLLPDIDRVEREALQSNRVRRQLLKLIVNVDGYVESSEGDIRYLEQRLIGKEDKVYDEFDRFMTEGDFRIGLFAPLALLCVVLAVRENGWWFCGLIFPILLAYVGMESYSRGAEGLAFAVEAGRIDLPTLERLATDPVDFVDYEALASSRHEHASPTGKQDGDDVPATALPG
jgi:hypothetical protein